MGAWVLETNQMTLEFQTFKNLKLEGGHLERLEELEA
jgi:hypothetical protein